MQKLLQKLIPLILVTISPDVKKMLKAFIAQLDEQAKKTTNPWDDFFVAILKEIINTD